MVSTLLVVPEEDLRAILEALLIEAGLEVHAAADGVSALAALRAGSRPDVIVSSINPAELGAYEFVQAVRAGDGTKDAGLPIVFTAGRDRALDRLRAWELGADGWVPRPHHVSELLTAIDDCLGRTDKQRLAHRSEEFEAIRREVAESKRR